MSNEKCGQKIPKLYFIFCVLQILKKMEYIVNLCT